MPAEWTTPHDWASGEVVTEALLDANVRDHALVTGEHVLAQYVTTAPAASVSFVQIAQGQYEGLRLNIRGRATDVGLDRVACRLQFSNGTSTTPTYDTANNYDWVQHGIVGASVVSTSAIGTTALAAGSLAGGLAGAGSLGMVSVLIEGHARSDLQKPVYVQSITRSGATAGDLVLLTQGGVWRSTAPIRALQVFPLSSQFSSGCVFSLYGHRSTSTST